MSAEATANDPVQPDATERRPAIASCGNGKAIAALLQAIERAEKIVERETAALRSRGQVDLREFEHRKSHALLDLTRAGRGVDATELPPEIVDRLRALRGALEANMECLSLHLDAVREIADVIAQAMLAQESDGTYSSRSRPGSRP